MLNDLKEGDKIIFEVGVNIPNYYIQTIHFLGWIFFYISVYFYLPNFIVFFIKIIYDIIIII